MKLTKETLKRIIKEEIEETYKEYPSSFDTPLGSDRFLSTEVELPHFDKIVSMMKQGSEGVNQAASFMEVIPEYGVKSISRGQRSIDIRFEAPEGASYDHSMGSIESEYIYRKLEQAGIEILEFYSDDTKAIISIFAK